MDFAKEIDIWRVNRVENSLKFLFQRFFDTLPSLIFELKEVIL